MENNSENLNTSPHKRTLMSRQNRAKQFAPFNAIKGLSKLLREKEKEHENFLKSKRVWEKFEDNP